ncbi:helix-turn-helix domain-containing protein [Clostridium cadaveris]|uniref:helix-turn-helix domain-containing protein n=1 Tax=Clostridium cadaveris TaxID=1529 RepID=UPI0039916184
MIEQEVLRKKLNDYRKTYGTTFAFVAKELNVSRTTISLFANNKRNLAKPICYRLEEFLNIRI